MKTLGQVLVGLWLLSAIVTLTQSAADPYASVSWGFGLLILGAALWYYGAKRERNKADKDWMNEQFKNQSNQP